METLKVSFVNHRHVKQDSLANQGASQSRKPLGSGITQACELQSATQEELPPSG